MKLGITRCSPNDLRRTYGTWLPAEGIEPQLIPPVKNGDAGASEGTVDKPLMAAKRGDALKKRVRGGGIEPPTRGFSVREEITDLPEKKLDPDVPRGGFGAVTDPDESVRTAIKAAVDAGRLELAARLLDVLREAPKLGAVVRLETAQRGR